MNFGLDDLMNDTTFGIPNEKLKKYFKEVKTIDMNVLNYALSSFQTSTGFDFYTLLTDNNVRKYYYNQDILEDSNEYIKEHDVIMSEIEDIQEN